MDRGWMGRAVKLFCILAGLSLLFLLWRRQRQTDLEIPTPEGEAVTVEDVEILLNALSVDYAWEILDTDAQIDGQMPGDYLTYGQYKILYDQIDGVSLGLPDYADKYKEEHHFLKEDWYQAFRILLAFYDTDSSIWQTTVFAIKLNTDEQKLYSENHTYDYLSSSFSESLFTAQEVYVKGDTLLTSIRILKKETVLKNVWIMEQEEDAVTCFYHQIQFAIPASLMTPGSRKQAERESVADLQFSLGKLDKVETRSEKIRGKLLRVTDDSIEVEELGIYETTDQMEIYKLYGSLETKNKSDLLIGYDVTDFVLHDGKICACLISREEETTMIRVLLKNTEMGGYYHEKVMIEADGEQTRITSGEMDNGERHIFASKALTDRVVLKTDGITGEDNTYRGSLEIYQAEDGLLIVNELPIEEYLYAVVPSEMPAYYPAEALKAQAVCARTYAVRFILHAGLAAYGAHLDNTTSYQVYHNIEENAATTTAVKETAGEILYYGNEPAANYYYSTSCGYGTDAGIWKGGNDTDVSYMHAGPISEESDTDVTDMTIEENFAAYITSTGESDLEKEEPWYRWRYEVENLDEAEIISRVKARYQANPSLVLTKKKGMEEDYFVAEEIGEIGEIKEIEICRRGPGGVAEELLIVGSKATLKIISEYNIRSVLCNGVSQVIRQDGSPAAAAVLLPSAFFILEVGKSEENVVGYTLIGGGYGHGVGMSQNAAKSMGNLGYDYKEILGRFFAGCVVQREESSVS